MFFPFAGLHSAVLLVEKFTSHMGSLDPRSVCVWLAYSTCIFILTFSPISVSVFCCLGISSFPAPSLRVLFHCSSISDSNFAQSCKSTSGVILLQTCGGPYPIPAVGRPVFWAALIPSSPALFQIVSTHIPPQCQRLVATESNSLWLFSRIT